MQLTFKRPLQCARGWINKVIESGQLLFGNSLNMSYDTDHILILTSYLASLQHVFKTLHDVSYRKSKNDTLLLVAYKSVNNCPVIVMDVKYVVNTIHPHLEL